jgi:exonuclease-1
MCACQSFCCLFQPAKLNTNEAREKDKNAIKLQADLLYDQGKFEQANSLYQRCTRVTSEMVQQFIHILKQLNIEYIVAPYEADAQLAYLMNQGIVDCCITEDSDLLPYGCKKVKSKTKQKHKFIYNICYNFIIFHIFLSCFLLLLFLLFRFF